MVSFVSSMYKDGSALYIGVLEIICCKSYFMWLLTSIKKSFQYFYSCFQFGGNQIVKNDSTLCVFW
jgi:hypothetical protein